MAISKKSERAKFVHDITFYPKRRVEIFLSLSSGDQSEILSQLSRKVQRNVLNGLGDDELVSLLEHFDPVDATHLVQLLPKKRGERIVERLSETLKGSVEVMLKFDSKTAEGIMSLDYIQVNENDTLRDAASKFKEYEGKTGRLPVVVVMREGRVVGYMPTHQFGFGSPTEKIGKHVKKIPKVGRDKNHDDVMNVFRKNRHDKVAVVGQDGNILGIIYSEDIIRLLREEQSVSLYQFAGVRGEEEVGDNVTTKVKFRYKWLIINLGTAFLAASTVGLFEGTISKYVLLAVYMPIVAGMGGNAATQTLAVIVRGIALRQIRLRTAWLTLKRELGAGLVNGFINGILVASVVVVINRDFMIAFILSMAMVINLFVAAFFGTIIPLVMKRLGKDPAASATIFITTATDVLGFLAFLGLASILLD